MFSKLDLRWGVDQIELEPNSRDVTFCATDDVIFRYKRLSFGVNAAPAKYQHIITQTMTGLKGRSKGLLTRHGIGPSKEKIRTVDEASEPQSQSEVRRFFGLVGFSASFIPSQPLLMLLGRLQDKGNHLSGVKSKRSHFRSRNKDKEAHTQIIAEASPLGLGAVLVEERNGECRAVCYASRLKQC